MSKPEIPGSAGEGKGISGNAFHKPGIPAHKPGAKSTPRASSSSNIVKRLVHLRSKQNRVSKPTSADYLA